MTSLLLALVLAQDLGARSGVGAARIGPVAYVVGGSLERGGFARSLLAYDFANKKWSEKARLPEPIAFPATASYMGKLYVFGGLHQDNTHCDHAHFYDPTTDRWTVLANLPTGRSRSSCTVMQGKIAVIGGIADEASVGKNSDKVELYDPVAKTWSRLAPMPTARHGHASEFVKDRRVVVGGDADQPGGQTTSVEVGSPTAGWSKSADLPEARGFPVSLAYEGEVWVFGNRGPATSPVHFDPTANKWLPSISADTTRHRGAAVEYQGKAYLFFGEESGGVPLRVFDFRRDGWMD